MKKLFALLLAVLMVLSIAACAPNQPATTTAPETTQPGAASNHSPDDWSSMNLTGIVEDDVIVIGIQTNATVTDYDNNGLTMYLEELTGLDIQFVHFSSDTKESQQQFALMLANRERLPDVLFGVISDGQVAEYGREGFLADQTEWIEKAHFFGKHLAVMGEFEKDYLFSRLRDGVTGAIYSYPAYQYKQSNDNNEWLGALSKTMAKNVGMDATEIDTIDEVYEFLTKTVHGDGNKNGKKDEIGLLFKQSGYRTNAELWIINAYIYCNDTYIFNVENGKLYYPYTTDEYRQAMITMNKWYSEGLISPLSYSIKNNAEAKAIIDAGPGKYTLPAWGWHPALACLSGSRISEDYTSMLALQDETGKGGYAPMRDPYTLGRNATIPVNEKDPKRMELAFRFCDLFADWEVATCLRYGVEGKNWKYLDGEKEGLKDEFGNWAGWEIIHDSWAEASADTWHTCPIGVIAEKAVENGIWRGEPPAEDITGTVTEISRGCTLNKRAVGMPDEYVYDLVYNADETETISELRGAYIARVKSTRAKFVSGILDPNNDKDWANYLKELESLGASELLDAAQSAYDRMYG